MKGDGTYLFSVLSSGGVQTLNEICRMTEEHRIAGCARNHRQHGQPHVSQTLRWKAAIADAQHV